MNVRAFDVAASRPWLILPPSLEEILAVADRMGDPEAVATRLGKPLDNARTVTMHSGVAVVPVTGPIMRYANLFTEISGATSTQVLATDIQAALDNPFVRGIVLDINSPGGEATGINELAQMIFDARGKKPIHAYVGGSGASAAYWIASAASVVTVDATSMLGSIGVVMTYNDTRKRDEKSDVRKLEIVSSSSPDKRLDPTTEAGRMKVQKVVDDLAAVFIATVARNRGVSVEAVQADFGRGGLLIGQHAVDAGMADRLGSLESVIAELAGSVSSTSHMRTSKMVTVKTTADLQAAVKAGHKIEDISIAAVDEAAIRVAAKAEGVEEGKAAATQQTKADVEKAVADERARIIAIQAMTQPGFEKEITEAITKGASADATARSILTSARDRGITLGAIQQDATATTRANNSGPATTASSWDSTVKKFGGK